MSDDRFEADWLTLREPVDHRSRSRVLEQGLRDALADMGARVALDLGCGTGSNLRHLAPQLRGIERWIAVDHDAELLARVELPSGVAAAASPGFEKDPAPDASSDASSDASPGASSGPVAAGPRPIAELERVPGRLEREGLEAIGRADVVTASALLDLVGAPWMDDFAQAVAAREAALLVALSWDGTATWSGGAPDPDDAWMNDTIQAHQRRAKGMGAALGPDAVPYLVAALERLGYSCRVEASPWRLQGRGDAPLAREWAAGWVQAAVELEPGSAARAQAWADRRVEALGRGEARVDVGHFDLLALPPAWARHAIPGPATP
jgi:SAM-dependent methyltransferase